jgi:hypothetical protein
MDLPFFLIITFTNATINNVNPIGIRHRFLNYPGGSFTTFVSNSWMAIIDGLYPPQKGEAVEAKRIFHPILLFRLLRAHHVTSFQW